MTAPREVAAAFWAALYDRDWERIRSFFGPESIYYDVPTGPTSAGRGPDAIEARLRLGLEGLSGYEHRPGVVATGPADRCAAKVREQFALGADGVILHGASPSELEPVVKALRS